MPRILCVLALALTFAGGCSRLTFVNQRFDNFSAYYNTFYNAEIALDECVAGFDLSVEDVPVDQDAFISLFGRNESGVTQRQPCEDAILKSADVLRDHPNSKWVDDAAMLIGKSYFFTVNFVGAEQKFKDILALDSPLEYEARFWLARTYIASGAYDNAYDHLQATLSGEDLPRRWEPQYRLALAELHVTREDWEEAAMELETGIPDVRDSDLASRAQLLLGQVYEVLERYDDAAQAYDEVLRYKPWYELSYAAQYSAIRVLTEHGNAEFALARLRRMERDDKNYDYRAQLSYMRGRTYQAMGDYDAALDRYYYLLHDEDGQESSVKGQVHYALALFFRDIEQDFQFAAAHFDTAKASLGNNSRGGRPASRTRAGATRQSSNRTQHTPGAITDAEEQARIYGSFSVVMDQILLMDSLLYLGSLDDSTYNAFVLGLRKQRAAEREELRKEEERRMDEEGFRSGANMNVGQGFGDLPAGKNIGQAEMGYLYHRDEIQMQQARNEFNSIWGERPLARNWRRIAAVLASQAQGEETDRGGDTLAMAGADDALPQVDVSDVPRDSVSQVKMREERAVAWYELGNVLFLSTNMPDSAAFWYRQVIEATEMQRPVAQRAYYALAEVQQALGDNLSADRIYREILERFEGTDFAVRAAERLGQPPIEAVVTDTLVLAEALYTANHSAWREGAYANSLQGMVDAARTYPTTTVAPRALYAAGNIYMAWANADSLDLFAPLPLTDSSAAWVRRSKARPLADSVDIQLRTVMDVLRTSYPTTKQAKGAESIILALDERWAKIMAPLDSLRRLDSLATADSLAMLDSLAVAALVDSLIVSDSLLLPAGDSLMAAFKDSLSTVVRDSLAAAAEDARIAANQQVEADTAATGEPRNAPQVAVEPAQGALRSSEVAEGGVRQQVEVNETSGGVEATDPRLRALNKQDPSLGNIDWSKGGYTIVVHSEQQHEVAATFARNFGRTLPHPVDVFTAAAERGVEFRIGVGLFETLSEAQQVMQQLQGQLPEGSEIVNIPRPSRY